eukprot:2998040-Alexandrium_andersonii.AAC.1
MRHIGVRTGALRGGLAYPPLDWLTVRPWSPKRGLNIHHRSSGLAHSASLRALSPMATTASALGVRKARTHRQRQTAQAVLARANRE